MQQKDVGLWHIYLVERCHHVRPEPKSKFVVTVGYNGSDEFWALMINSRIGPFIQNRPYLLTCEADIVADQHRSLDHDSYIDCTNIYSFYAWDFKRDKGVISKDAGSALLEAVRSCPTLKTKHKRMILTSLGDELGD